MTYSVLVQGQSFEIYKQCDPVEKICVKTVYKGAEFYAYTVLQDKFIQDFDKFCGIVELFKDKHSWKTIKTDTVFIVLVIDIDILNFIQTFYLKSDQVIQVPQTASNLLTIQQVLDIDTQFRHQTVTGDIYTLDQIVQRNWDYSVPTVVYPVSHSQMKLATDIKKFKQRFFQEFYFLKDFNFDNVLIAGGCIQTLLLNQDMSGRDIDMFIYGLNEEEGVKKVLEIVRFIENYETEFYSQFNIIQQYENMSIHTNYYQENDYSRFYVATDKYFSIQMDTYKIQVIYRLYSTKSEILHGFDLGSSAVGFNGKDVYFTTLSKFSYENMVNVVDTTRRSTTYERRLHKYLKRGFSIAIPKLDIKQIGKQNYFKKVYAPILGSIILPKMRIDFNLQIDNIISYQNITIYSNNPKKDYDPDAVKYSHILDKVLDDGTLKINWLTQNPGTQLTSSINPIIENERDWYGIYYLK